MKNLPFTKDSTMPVYNLVNIDSLQSPAKTSVFLYHVRILCIVSSELLNQVNFRIPSYYSRNHDIFAIPFFKLFFTGLVIIYPRNPIQIIIKYRNIQNLVRNIEAYEFNVMQ